MGIFKKIVVGLIPFAVEMGIKKSQEPKNILFRTIGYFLIIMSIIFGLVALHQYLNTIFSPLEVNLIFCVGFAFLALIIFMSIQIHHKIHKNKSTGLFNRTKEVLTNSNLSELSTNFKDSWQQNTRNIKQIGHHIKTDMRQHSSKYLLAAAVVGLILGARTRGKHKNSTD